jgi:acetyltransferase-like isoleucine patch superfamily enzyme
VLGPGVRIGAGVDIACDELELGEGATIGDGASITAPAVALGEGCVLGAGLRAELNERLRLGRRSAIGGRGRIAAQAVDAGEFLWVKEDVIVGGGGAQGPRSYLRVGDRTSIFDRAFVNVSEEVEIGSDSALSFNVAVLTHGAWQPLLEGYGASFAPVRIGDHAVVYVGSVVLPGVTIGSHATVAAGSVVAEDVPDRCLAAGNPARVRRGPPDYPPPLEARERERLVGAVLAAWRETLTVKGVEVVAEEQGRLTLAHQGRTETVAFPATGGADITLAFGPGSSGCHFDLAALALSGRPSPLAEDLRDFLRRHAIRVFTDRPFRRLPPANLARLARLRESDRD